MLLSISTVQSGLNTLGMRSVKKSYTRIGTTWNLLRGSLKNTNIRNMPPVPYCIGFIVTSFVFTVIKTLAQLNIFLTSRRLLNAICFLMWNWDRGDSVSAGHVIDILLFIILLYFSILFFFFSSRAKTWRSKIQGPPSLDISLHLCVYLGVSF